MCSSEKHPIVPTLRDWISHGDQRKLNFKKADLQGGDLLFLVSCTEKLGPEIIEKYKKALVLHASDLPRGRGWSPYIWEILKGAEVLTLSLLEADQKIDAGKIWKKVRIPIEDHELIDEINVKLFKAQIELMNFAVENFETVKPEEQESGEYEYYPKRTPKDSELDPKKTLEEQFNLLRVCDFERYPAYFEFKGEKYKIKIEKYSE